MMRQGAAHAAAWITPALLTVLASRVASGHVEAPLLVLLTVAAPLVALLRPPLTAARNPVTRVVILIVVGLVVWANVSAFADVAALLGGARWHGAVLAAALTLLVTVWPAADRGRAAVLMLIVGVACVLAVAAAAAVAAGRTPWSAWNDVASRPALVFSERGAVARITRDTTLQFSEAHHVVALRGGAFRVAEQEGARTLLREWLVRDNDVLTLRPGDRLSLPAGARVRFEVGKRVPGGPASGAQWADAPARGAARTLPALLGLAITLLGGAAALVPPWTRGVRGLAAIVPLVCGWAAVCCGIYAVAIAPELVLADAPAAALIAAARTVPHAGAAAGFTIVGCAGLLALLIAAAQSLRARVVEVAGASAPAMWTAVFVLAAAGSIWPIDAWIVLSTALGLAACAWAAPFLAAGDEEEEGGWSPAALGSIAGVLAFGVLAALAARLPDWAGGVGDYPALMAAPVAWAVAVRARRPSARRAGGTARWPSATSDP
jgi:hypothetical protein